MVLIICDLWITDIIGITGALPVVSGKYPRQLSKSISKTKDDAPLRTGLLPPPKGIGFPPKLCWRYFLWKITGRAFLQVLLQAQPPAVTDRPGSPAPSQRLSSSPLSDKRGFWECGHGQAAAGRNLRSPFGFCAPDPRTCRARKRNADPKMESGKKVTTFNRCLPVEGRYSCILGSIIDVTSHSSVFGKLWSFACWGTLSDTSDSPFPDSYYTQIRRNINSQGC